jgi:hypothetical protein
VVIPSRQALGVYCVFGGPSNLWDLKPGMDAGDGIHLTSPANAALAQAIAQGLFDSFAPRSGPELVALRAVGGQADLTPEGRIRCLFDALLPHAEAVLELDLSPRVSGPFTLEATVQAADAEPVPATGRLQVCVEVGAAGVSAPPRLRHARSGGHLTLSWTNEDRACVLESAANLLFPVWRRDSSPQLQTDNQVTATIEAAGRERWYRLRR